MSSPVIMDGGPSAHLEAISTLSSQRLSRHKDKVKSDSVSEMSLSDLSRSRSRSGSRSSQKILLNGVPIRSVKKSKSRDLREKLKVQKQAAKAQTMRYNELVRADKAKINALETELINLREEFKNIQMAFVMAQNSENDFVELNKKRKLTDLQASPAMDNSSSEAPFKPYAASQGNSVILPQQPAAVASNQFRQCSSSAEMNPNLVSPQSPMSEDVVSTPQFKLKKTVVNPAPADKHKPPVKQKPVENLRPEDNASKPGSSGVQKTLNTGPPPIKATDLNIKATSELMEQMLGHKNFTFHHASPRDTFIRTTSKADHTAVVELLSKSDVEGHSFTPMDERKTTLLLRNACSSFTAQDIEEGIREYDIDVRVHSIEPFTTDTSRRSNQSLGIWRITLNPGSDVGALLAKKYIGFLSGIRYERMRSNGPTQCRNCQQFGHSASNCFRNFRCVKCQLTHKPGECPTDIAAATPRPAPACVNCGQIGHPANFRGCAHYKQLYQRMEDRKRLSRRDQEEKQRAFNNKIRPGRSYASHFGTNNTRTDSARANTATQSNQGSFNGFNIDRECSSRFGMSFEQMMDHLTSFAPVFLQAKDKNTALMQLMISIHPSYQQQC